MARSRESVAASRSSCDTLACVAPSWGELSKLHRLVHAAAFALLTPMETERSAAADLAGSCSFRDSSRGSWSSILLLGVCMLVISSSALRRLHRSLLLGGLLRRKFGSFVNK